MLKQCLRLELLVKKKINRNQNITFDFGIAHGIFDKNTVYTKSPFLHDNGMKPA
mgnify:CR=1 FL=1